MANSPLTIEQAMQISLEHHQAGRLVEAELGYRQVLAREPNHAMAYYKLAGIFMSQARQDDALAACSNAIRADPHFAEAYSRLGNILQILGRLDEAIAAYSGAIGRKPAYAVAYNNLAMALRDRGRIPEAAEACARAVQLQPDLSEAHNNLGNILKDQGGFDEAIAAYLTAIALKPTLAEAHCNLGSALAAQGKLDEAAAAYSAAIQIRPNDADAVNNLAGVLIAAGKLDEALAIYDRAMALKPRDAAIHSNRIYLLNFHPDYDAKTIYGEHRKWNQLHAAPLAADFGQPHRNPPDPNRRLRIGYVSPDFIVHPVGRFLLPLLENHDHGQFEIFCYSDVRAPDPMTDRLRSHADAWRNIVGLPDEKVAEWVRQDGIDVLVDLAGHTSQNRLLVFARKPAPVQVTYLGYPATTGMTAIDYRITDSLADPPGMAESFHAERLERLPESFLCFSPPVESLAVAAAPAQKAGRVTFGSFNTCAKVNASIVGLWAQVLHRSPGAKMLIKSKALASSSARQHLLDLFAAHRIAADRLDLRSMIASYLDHLRMYDEVDIALDAFPYHGTTTTCEALWMGVPVVSLAGDAHRSRVGVSILTNVGLGELIARSADGYVRIAVELAADAPRLAQLRAGMRERMKQSPLMDAPRSCANIEAAYRRMWRRYVG